MFTKEQEVVLQENIYGIYGNVARRVIRDWVCREHHKDWQSIPGQRHAKGFLDGPSAKRTNELLKAGSK
jgi:hypothetical protein